MRYLIAANWKMNKTVSESIDYVEKFREMVKDVEGIDIMIAPSFTALASVSPLLEKTSINLGAQNMFYIERGAYTGEISPIMLNELNVKYVIIGHSERRHIFGEKDDLINKKILAAVEYGLRPILCVGETLEERELGKTMNVVERQIKLGVAGLEREIGLIDIAYEPVWAIGTGVNATVEQAQEVHLFIRNLINDISKGNDSDTRILYGGSVNEKNAGELIKAKNVEGFLVGTASLDPHKFYKIILETLEV
ncbi:triose-phosphate isomerase [Sulfurihydrogenibium sp.]|uniref:triose-phosphate isomerase n=1 Tax=Sulfurihydrogenibium sp. TaxID=2053621 RepID=UPI002609C3B5|nr:triose-phosphate isomerase [Sulfurihydrogenibium sp.]